MSGLSYVDASALAKLVVDEPGSDVMARWYFEAERVSTSVIGIIETRRAATRRAHDPAHLEATMRSVVAISLDRSIVRTAATVGPPSLRTLDAIHLATALGLGDELEAFVTYDDRLAEAARMLGLPVVRPA